MAVNFFVLGVNHRSAGIELRERLSLATGQQEELAARLLSANLTQEAAVLCTCNRIEIYGACDFPPARERLLDALTDTAAAPCHNGDSFYFYSGERALAHLFRVASSLDSQIVGETHVLGQVKECYERARKSATAGKWLNIFFQKSFQVAKKVRSETAITALPVSTGSCAVAVARRIFEQLATRKVLVVGAGQTGKTVARHFVKHGVSLAVANRTMESAQQLSAELGGTPVNFQQWQSLLSFIDIAVFATSAREPLLTLEQAAATLPSRKNQPLLLMDLSVPRNLDPALGRLQSVFLYDLDSVQGLVDAHYTVRVQEAERAEQIIAAWAGEVWSRTADPAPGCLDTLKQQILALRSGPACPK
ncbi:MAG: glutamyl-tRNA reductase [Acidobacteria bacterium]|nr:glutamyl-tRNA reductase [Acidobacteriota bacterium]